MEDTELLENESLDFEPDNLPPVLHGVLESAVEQGASDVHVDWIGDEAAVRFRVDGAVREQYRLAEAEGHRLIKLIEVAGRMKIDAVFSPREGQFRWASDHERRDVRATIIPTKSADTAHLRLLSSPKLWKDIRGLGFDADQVDTIKAAAGSMHGLILICGRTGSGKTTTLYGLTELIDLSTRIGISVEDPVEYDLPYLRQVQIDEKHDLTMAEAIRVLLRADPDLIIVGEVRDQASAVTAARAALAGRLVMATLHASDTAGAIDAMYHLNTPHYVLGNAARLIIAQDLVRCLCQHCVTDRKPTDRERELFEAEQIQTPAKVFDPVGCENCSGYGYKGRTGVFEVVAINNETGAWLASGQSQQLIHERFLQQGMKTVTAHALEKASRGITSMAEVFQVTADRDRHSLHQH